MFRTSSPFVPGIQPQYRPFGRTGGGGFTPPDIAGLELWMDASQITGLNDGDPVATWADLSGEGNDATQATSTKRPTYKTGIVNSLPVVRFDGTSDTLVTPYVDLATQTIFLVARGAGAGGGGVGRVIASMSTRGTGTFGSASGWGFFQVEGAAIADYGGAYGTWAQIALTQTAASATPYYNGAAGSSFNPTDTVGNVIVIGNESAGSNSYFDGDIAEVIIYDSALGATDRQTVEAYLATKWGL